MVHQQCVKVDNQEQTGKTCQQAENAVKGSKYSETCSTGDSSSSSSSNSDADGTIDK